MNEMETTGTAGPTEQQMRTMGLVADFSSGEGVLEILAGRAPGAMPLLSREEMLGYFAAFESAWDPLAELQAKGQLTGAAPFSSEVRAQITRLSTLLRLEPESPEAKAVAAEIRALAEACFTALNPQAPRRP